MQHLDIRSLLACCYFATPLRTSGFPRCQKSSPTFEGLWTVEPLEAFEPLWTHWSLWTLWIDRTLPTWLRRLVRALCWVLPNTITDRPAMFCGLGCLCAMIDARHRGHPSCVFNTILQNGHSVNQIMASTTCSDGHMYAGMAYSPCPRLDIVMAKLNDPIFPRLYVVVASNPQNRTAGSLWSPTPTAGSIVINSAEVIHSGARSYVLRRAYEFTIRTRAHMKP